jgi:hypothetical protein
MAASSSGSSVLDESALGPWRGRLVDVVAGAAVSVTAPPP